MTHVIYKITSPSGKVYIGRTKDFVSRMGDHKYNAFTAKENNSLYKACRKYGWDNMIKEVIDRAGEGIIQQLEEKYIAEFDTVRNGYNDCYIGGGGNVWEGKQDTQQFKDFKNKMKIINSGENNGMFGRTHSEETRAKMKAKAAGRCSLEWFINKHGEVEGTRRYESMMEKRRKNRYAKMKTDSAGRFTKA